MPPKAKDKKNPLKGKQSAVVDGLSTEEMSKEQLEEHIVRLREELDREREERSYFQLERDKMQAFWEICKRSLEEAEAGLRVGQREREEVEERHRVEINVYKQKLKLVLSEQHSTVSGLKMDAVTAASLIQNQNTQTEVGLRGELSGLRASDRKKQREEVEERHRVEINVYKQKLKLVLSEQHSTVSGLKMDAVTAASLIQNQNTQTEVGLRGELSGLRASDRKKQLDDENHMKELKLKQQVELMELTNDYERRITDMAMKFQERMQRALDQHEKEKSAEIQEVEERWRRRVATQVEDQDRALRHAEAHEKELLQLKHKEEVEQLKKELQREERKLAAARRESDRLQEAEQKLPQLQKQLEEQEKERSQMLKSRARVKLIQKELDDLSVEHELLLHAFQKVVQERDELLRKQTAAIVDVQQQRGLKELLLERKLAALTDTLEEREAQLGAIISASKL